jgi:hypothetical protein
MGLAMKNGKGSMFDFSHLGGYETQEQIDHHLKHRQKRGRMDDRDGSAVPEENAAFGEADTANGNGLTGTPLMPTHSGRRTSRSGAGGGGASALGLPPVVTPDYSIPTGGPVSEAVLANYLERSLRVTDLSQMWEGGWVK